MTTQQFMVVTCGGPGGSVSVAMVYDDVSGNVVSFIITGTPGALSVVNIGGEQVVVPFDGQGHELEAEPGYVFDAEAPENSVLPTISIES